MNMNCCGGVTFNRPLTKKEAKRINLLLSDFLEQGYYVEEGDDELEIPDQYGDCEDELNALHSEFSSIIDDINVNYYGDYDGGYRIVDGKLKNFDISDLGIIDAQDEELIAELERRGYKVISTKEASA